MDARLHAVCDLMVSEAREYSGLHGYDGIVQDLSPHGVRRGLAELGGPPLEDPHDEAHLAAFEEMMRATFGELELHRRNPMVHLANLDLSCYDKRYAPPEERAQARWRHLAGWPEAVQGALVALDQVPAPVAAALLEPARGLAAGLAQGAAAAEPAAGMAAAGTATGADTVLEAALAAHRRLLAHLRLAAERGDPNPALGGSALARLMGAGEGEPVDLGVLADRAGAERDRLTAMLAAGCQAIAGDRPVRQVVADLVADHPDADGVLAEARDLTAEVIAFTRDRQLVPHNDGECLVEPAPPSRRWAMAMMSGAAPGEPDGPAYYHVTPPDPSWSPQDQEDWLAVFSRTTLPAITAHEVAPGHFSHSRSIRQAPSPVRRLLASATFVEGWAHYAEELCVEERFRDGDHRFVVGVAVEALIRVTRLACAIGLHTGAMTVDEAARQFESDAHLRGPAARSEALRGTFDPTYGRYTWGKLALQDLRQRARQRWGASYSHRRFHSALLELGSPPLGLLDTALERG